MPARLTVFPCFVTVRRRVLLRDANQIGAVEFQLARADAGNFGQLFGIFGAMLANRVQRLVVQNDVGRNRLLLRQFATVQTQRIE